MSEEPSRGNNHNWQMDFVKTQNAEGKIGSCRLTIFFHCTRLKGNPNIFNYATKRQILSPPKLLIRNYLKTKKKISWLSPPLEKNANQK